MNQVKTANGENPEKPLDESFNDFIPGSPLNTKKGNKFHLSYAESLQEMTNSLYIFNQLLA